MPEFPLRHRSPEDQAAYFTEKIAWLTAQRNALLEAVKMAYRCCRVTHGAQSELCVRLASAIASAEESEKSA